MPLEQCCPVELSLKKEMLLKCALSKQQIYKINKSRGPTEGQNEHSG